MALESAAEFGKVDIRESGGVMLSLVTDEPEEEAPPNPMLIDLIIDNLLGFLDFKTLGRCRRVSKQWFKTALPHWLSQGPKIKLLLEITPIHPGDHRRREGFKNMSEFLQLVMMMTPTTTTTSDEYSYCGLRQYKKFEVEGCLGGGDAPCRRRELLEEFLRECGERITDLKLSITNLDLATYQAIMLSRMTPNLEKLDVCVGFDKEVDVENGVYELEPEAHEKLKTLQIDFEADELRQPLPVLLWVQLLKRYPNLETLVYGVDTPAKPQDADNMLEAIWTIRQTDNKVLDLKRLEVRCAQFEVNADYRLRIRRYDLKSLLPLLRNGKLALKTFGISIGELTPSQAIYEILDSQAATLRTLVLHYHKLGPLLEDFQPPQMDCVEELELHGGRPFPNLAFLKSFPNLKSLTCSIFSSVFRYDELASLASNTKDEALQEQLMVIPTLSKLHCNYDEDNYGNYRPEDIRKLHRVMPNLTDLQMWLDNESFRAVCHSWPGLKSLRIIGNQVDDKGILGGRSAPPGNMLLPSNIRNLEELESLSMAHFDADFVDEVGHAAITGGCVSKLLSLPKLKKLEITLSEEQERKYGYLLQASVVRVQGREIDVKIRFANREPHRDRSSSVDEAEEGESDDERDSDDEGEADDAESDDDEERGGAESVEDQRDDDDGGSDNSESQDGDGIIGV